MKKIGILLLVTVPALLNWAAPTVLTLDKSVEQALESNLDYQISGISLQEAKRQKNSSWNNFLPQLSATSELSGEKSLSENTDTTWRLSAGLSLRLPLNGGLAYTIKDIKLAYENQSISYETARLQLINEVEQAFYSLIANQADIDIAKNNIDLAEKRYQVTLRNFNNGLATELDTLQARVTAAQLKPAYLQAVSDYNIALREFLDVIGLPTDTEITLEGSLDTEIHQFDSDQLIEKYLMNRRDILAQEKKIEILENQKKQKTMTSRTPDLSLSSQWGTSVMKPFESSSWDTEKLSDTLSLGLSLSIPLDDFIPGSATDTTLKGMDDEIKSAKLTLVKNIEDARTEIINLVSKLETSAAQIELAKLNVELTKTTYEKSEYSYNQGGMGRLDLEDTQQNYFNAKQEYLESQYNYLNGLINLRYALGLENLAELSGSIQKKE
ncbi:TolC family protein [Spirochaeta cellobiosiphila]|uniref:TolC family protein n=1 Tax=Spirochaeta cellobiosiphila TaxID=504483 RepID=UPI000407A5DD|nr:TolC family protein [Spirochaeta cellobiosiphila]